MTDGGDLTTAINIASKQFLSNDLIRNRSPLTSFRADVPGRFVSTGTARREVAIAEVEHYRCQHTTNAAQFFIRLMLDSLMLLLFFESASNLASLFKYDKAQTVRQRHRNGSRTPDYIVGDFLQVDSDRRSSL